MANQKAIWPIRGYDDQSEGLMTTQRAWSLIRGHVKMVLTWCLPGYPNLPRVHWPVKPDPGAWPLTQDTWSPQQSLMPLMPRMSDVTPHRSFKLLTLVSERLLVTSALGHTSLWHADAVLIGVISWPLKLSNEESSRYLPYNMYVRYMKVPDEGEWVNHDISSEI